MNQSARAAGPARGAAVSIFARPIARRALVVVSLIGLILLFFNRMAFSNLILARGDTFLYFYPYWTAAAEALRAGRVPLWNPDLFMGAPFLANSQAGFFYPLNWPVWLLLPAPYAVSASILLHLLIAALGAYLAGRRTLALGRTAALFAAALFAMGGYLTAQVEHVNQLQGLAWLPWFFVALSPIVDRQVGNPWRDWLRAILFVGALFALQLLAGHTQTAFISGVAVVLWVAFRVLPDLTGRRTGVRLRPVRSSRMRDQNYHEDPDDQQLQLFARRRRAVLLRPVRPAARPRPRGHPVLHGSPAEFAVGVQRLLRQSR